MRTKEKNLPVFVKNGVDDMNMVEQHFPVFVGDGVGCSRVPELAEGSEFSGEFSVGPVSFKGSSRSSDGSGSVLGGVLVGGAVAIGAVAVTLALLGASKNS